MCTAISYKTTHHYFGRNLDVERGYGENVVMTPRNYPLAFRYIKPLTTHYALIGMAVVMGDYPLYFETTNEMGLSMAGLNFPENAMYYDYQEGKENIAPFELIPYLLGKCSSVKEVKEALENVNVVHCNFSEQLSVTPLHWMISDKEESITLECVKDGMKVYENPVDVLTNNPPFELQMKNWEKQTELPGDFSSSSRFIKAVFVKDKSVCNGSEKESVHQFFRILQSVAMPKGCVMTKDGLYQYTRYTCCCNTDTQVYYYMTYDDMTIQTVNLHEMDLDDDSLYEKES